MRDDPIQNLIRDLNRMIDAIQKPKTPIDPFNRVRLDTLREVRARVRGYVPATESVLKLGTKVRVVEIERRPFEIEG
jgi:hypothetical protein